MAKSEKVGEIGVDTGMLLIVDPVYLFSAEDWKTKVGARADELGGDYPTAVLQILAELTGIDMERSAAVAPTGGDGRFDVIRTDDAIVIGTG